MVPSVHQLSPIMMAKRKRECSNETKWMSESENQNVWKTLSVILMGLSWYILKLLFLFYFFLPFEKFYFNKMFLEWCCKHRFNILFICTLIFVFKSKFNVEGRKDAFSPYALKWRSYDLMSAISKRSRCLQAVISSLQVNRRHATETPHTLSVVLYIGSACEISTKCQRKVYFSVHSMYVCNITDFHLQVLSSLLWLCWW